MEALLEVSRRTMFMTGSAMRILKAASAASARTARRTGEAMAKAKFDALVRDTGADTSAPVRSRATIIPRELYRQMAAAGEDMRFYAPEERQRIHVPERAAA